MLKHMHELINSSKKTNRNLVFYYLRSALLHHFLPYSWIDDKYWLEYYYYCHFGHLLNLNSPNTFNEKIQWFKLYDRNPLYTDLTDKLIVRNFVLQKLGSEYLTKEIGIINNVEEIDWNDLPNPCVIKPNHGAGWIIFFENPENFDINNANKLIIGWLKTNFYHRYREWQYKNIRPKIIIEEKIVSRTELGLVDYKFFCFNGNPILIQVNVDRFSDFSLAFFDLAWKKLPITLEHYKSSSKEIPKPTELEKMIEISKILTEGLPFCRVDLYNTENRIIFGELTFTPNAGLLRFFPNIIDYELGKYYQLPNK